MKILVSAIRCSPGDRREAGATWAWCKAAARDHEVWLVTRGDSAELIRKELVVRPVPGLIVVPLDLPWRRDYWWSDSLWFRHAARKVQRLHDEHDFAVIHHLTVGQRGVPTGTATSGRVRVIWGPVSLPTPIPLSLTHWLGQGGLLAELGRRIGAAVTRWMFSRRAARQADLVVAQDNDVAARLDRRVIVEPMVAIRPVTGGGGPGDGFGAEGTSTAVFAGRLVPDKGLLLAINALARPAAARWELRVMGDGPDWRRAERLAERLGVRDRVEFRGDVPRAQVLTSLLRADALLAPWLRAPAAWTIAESLARGCPVVCLDRGAPAALVGPGEGAVVPWRGDVVGALADALGNITRRIDPVTRWAPDRLPAILADWYSTQPASR
ncbi:glycosyltransferase family 4 protein [Kribbella monticola]|uniref:glycosyltransferase family 4 protein n=1 Tax=Kribbella monticola TaxID=2185285 RepID=UPI000DD3FED4|nr:glycosyltransferase [Kribbella monticola]